MRAPVALRKTDVCVTLGTGAWWSRARARRGRPPWQALLGGIALLAFVAAAAFLVLVAANGPSSLSPPSHVAFPGWMAGPLHGLLPGFSPGRMSLKIGFTAAVAGMYVCYLVALGCVSRLRIRWLIAAIVALHVILVLSPPLSLTDVFNYLNYGRMPAVHGLNPYVVIPAHEPATDPTFHLSNWHHLVSPYGPLFTLGMEALSPLGVPVSYWVLKLLTAAASLGTLTILWRCAPLAGRSPRAVLAFTGLNPLWLVWGLGGTHNDAFMMLALVAGAWLALTRREVRGGLALAAAVAIKASGAAIVPVLVLAAQRRWRAALGVAAGGVVLGAATYAAFGAHLPNLGQQSRLVAGLSLPNLLGLALGYGGESAGLRTALNGALVAIVAGACVWAWRRRDPWTAAGVVMLGLLLTLSWAMPWYILWLLPFAALATARWLRGAALVLGVYLLMAWMPLMPNLVHSLQFHPTRTPLGRENNRLIHRLLH
jgi:Glycosyltransferase family 87